MVFCEGYETTRHFDNEDLILFEQLLSSVMSHDSEGIDGVRDDVRHARVRT